MSQRPSRRRLRASMLLAAISLLIIVWGCGGLSGFECKAHEDCGPSHRCAQGWCKPTTPAKPIPEQPPDATQPACQSGQERPCMAELARLATPCKAGIQRCQDGQWGPCQGYIEPVKERCGDVVDNDCDGDVDEGCTNPTGPNEGEQRPCYTGPAGTVNKGICKAGTQTYTLGQWSTCSGQILPQPEQCDAIDNNCDGVVDETCHVCQPTKLQQQLGLAPHKRSGLIARSHDGSVIAQGWSTERPIHLWDASKLHHIRTLSTSKRTTSQVQWMAYHPTQPEILMVYRQRQSTIDLWNADEGSFLRSITLPASSPSVLEIKLQPSGAHLGMLDSKGVLHLLAIESETWQQLPKEALITTFAFHVQEAHLFYLTHALQRWDIKNKRALGQMWTAGDPLEMIHLRGPDALLLRYRGSRLQLRDLATGQVKQSLSLSGLRHLRHDSKQEHTYILDYKGLLQKYTWSTQVLSKGIQTCPMAGGLVLSKDEQLSLVACTDGRIKQWQLASGQPQAQAPAMLQSHTDEIHRLLFHPQGDAIASASNDGTVRIWPLQPASGQATAPAPTVLAHAAALRAMAWSPDGRYLLTSTADKQLWIWDRQTQRQLRPPQTHSSVVGDIRFSADGRFFATSEEGGAVSIWSAPPEAKEQFGRTLPPGSAASLHFSTDSALLLAGAEDGHIHSWNTSNGSTHTPFFAHNAPLLSLSLGLDGHILVTSATDHSLKFWNWQTRTLQHAERHTLSDYRSVRFRPRSQHITTARATKIIQWRTDGTRLAEWKAHDLSVYSLAWSPDGRRLASAGKDEVIKIWSCP